MDAAFQKLGDYIIKWVLEGLAKLLLRKPLPVETQYFSIAQAGQFTGFSEKAMRDKIALGFGPEICHPGGGRNIRIKREDLIAWAEGGAE